MRWVILHLGWQCRAWAYVPLVDKVYAREPSAVQIYAILCIGLELRVVLTTHEVPHKVSPEHIAHLVAEEEGYILHCARLVPYATLAIIDAHKGLATLHSHPVALVGIAARVVPHSGPYTHSLRGVLIAVEYHTLLVLTCLGVEPRHRLGVVVARRQILVVGAEVGVSRHHSLWHRRIVRANQ